MLLTPAFARPRRASGPAAPGPLLTGLVAYWDLDEASGQRDDSSGNGRHLTDTNAVGSGAGIGGVGTAAHFVAGNQEQLERAHEAAFQAGSAFTLAAWGRAANTSTPVQYLVAKGQPPLGGGEWGLVFNGGEFRWRVRGSSAQAEVTAGAIANNTWGFVVAEVDGTTIRASLDNGTAATGTVTGGAAAGTNALGIGSRVGGSWLTGAAQYVGIWNRVLTAGEKAFLYNAGAGRAFAALSSYGE